MLTPAGKTKCKLCRQNGIHSHARKCLAATPEFAITHTVVSQYNDHKTKKRVMKSITKLSLVVLTAMAFAAFPASAQSDSTSTNTPPAPRMRTPPGFNGTITAVDATAMTLTLKARTGNVTVKVTSDTKITKDREPGVFADAKEGLRVSGSGKKQDDGSWVATTLRISTKVPRPPAATAPPANPPPASPEQK
jgi:hypothetical protein